MPAYHIPVLLNEAIDALVPDSTAAGGVFVDATLGGGGHTKALLERLEPTGRLFCFDQDPDAEANIPNDPRCVFVRSNFRYLWNFMRYYEISQIDGLLADLGVSSHHFDDSARGFTFRDPSSPLDMRMNTRGEFTAADILNTYDEEQLANIFRLFGELRDSRRLAAAVVSARQSRPFATAADLLDATQSILAHDTAKNAPARLFQALRIEVNHEMDALRDLLMAATDLLRPGGRLVVLTYHSLEDRLVKNVMKTGNIEGNPQQDPLYGTIRSPFRALGGVITPSADEQQRNPRSRSAKLRIAEKLVS